MNYKVTIIGFLEFANSKSFLIAMNVFIQRAETYYKNDILTKAETIFDEEGLKITIPRSIFENTPDKAWKNTQNLLRSMSEFAIYGKIDMWRTDEANKVISYENICPDTDKAAVLAYNKGRKLSKIEGKELEALASIDEALGKYQNHAFAYERRGFTNYKLDRLHDAIVDFNKSNSIIPNPHSYIGLAHVYIKQKDYNKAIEELEKALTLSIPLMTTFWMVRRLKGECHYKNKNYELAIFDLKFFVKRAFKESDTNYQHKLKALIVFAKANFEAGKHDDGVKALLQAREIDPKINFEKLLAEKFHPIINKYEELVKIENMNVIA
jgi:tetratricopeptide (TPR) repeat protein